MSLIEGREHNAKESKHCHTPIDELGITAEDGITLSGLPPEHWHSSGNSKGKESEGNRNWRNLDLLENVEASVLLSSQCRKHPQHCQSAVCYLRNCSSKSAKYMIAIRLVAGQCRL